MCRICGSEGRHATFAAREMMHGLREPFDYFQCADCFALQIATVPYDMARYYPHDYYSIAKENPLNRWLKNQRLSYLANGNSIVGRVIHQLKSRSGEYDWIPVGFPKDSAILDIGCGRGDFLEELFLRGYKNLLGIDPFLPPSRKRSRPFGLDTTALPDLPQNEKFDFVIMNHAYEHIPNPIELLDSISTRMEDEAVLCLRIPVLAKAWETFGIDWAQLDAPRHIVLNSYRSMEVAAERAGLKVVKSWCDSNAFQFWASIQYQRDIPMMAPNSWYTNQESSIFTQAEVDVMEAEAVSLNDRGEGDQAVFWLKKRDSTILPERLLDPAKVFEGH